MNWGGGDFQFLKSGSDEPCIQPIESSQLVRGDMGTSLMSGVPVTQLIGQRLEPSLSLAMITLVFTLAVAIPLGILAAWRRGRLLDRAVMGFSVLGFSVPVFVTSYVLIWAFAIKLGWFNVQGYTPLAQGFWPYLHRLVLPSLALSTVYVALIARITRTSIIEVMGEDFIRTARAKGLGETGVLLGHALRNAAVPIATVIGVGVALLISGVVVTESVFNIPGLGRLVVEAVMARDYPVIQGLTLFFAFVYVFINLVVDCAYTVFDPRIRY
ncbi:ABC transporter, permease protein [Bordetella pertussis H918]|nr:ABC transporter permease [Bordetella pertussis 137]ETH38151.1 ABC transporter, permease protein [Bordetella pertussis H918]KCV21999.1 ABC transporter, permease protein [Bordetella pertussis B200]